MRLHSIGVRLSETNPETRMATLIVTANSRNSRPSMPPKNSTGINTATRDTVIDTIVKPISREPFNAASIAPSPSSMRRTMFSSITTASSTTNPTDNVKAISERLSRLKPSRYIAANVKTIEVGSARVGMIVALTLRINRKMTSTTSPMALRVHGKRLMNAAEPAYRQIGVAALKSGSHVVDANAAARQCRRIELRAHGVLLSAGNQNLRDSADG